METELWERTAERILEDGGGSYTGPALRFKYKYLVDEGLQGLQAEGPDMAGRRGMVYGGVGGYVGGRGAGGADEENVSISSLDDLDRELMGELVGEGNDDDEDADEMDRELMGEPIGESDGEDGGIRDDGDGGVGGEQEGSVMQEETMQEDVRMQEEVTTTWEESIKEEEETRQEDVRMQEEATTTREESIKDEVKEEEVKEEDENKDGIVDVEMVGEGEK